MQNWPLAPNQVKHGSAVCDGDGPNHGLKGFCTACKHLFMDATQLKQSSICYGWVSCDVGMADWVQRIGCKIGHWPQIRSNMALQSVMAMDQTMA